MLYRVVISHRQSEFICKFAGERIPPTVFVFDAPTPQDIDACLMAGFAYATVDRPGNRSANRNAGLAAIVERFALHDDDVVEFVDGDRYPVMYSEDKVKYALSAGGCDALLYGCECDSREDRYHIPKTGVVRVDTGRIFNPFYSCGFAIRMGAIRRVMDYNGGSLFDTRFNRWGCEDQWLGIECSNLGVVVGTTRDILLAGSVGGDSDDHTDYVDSLQLLVDNIIAHGFPLR